MPVQGPSIGYKDSRLYSMGLSISLVDHLDRHCLGRWPRPVAVWNPNWNLLRAWFKLLEGGIITSKDKKGLAAVIRGNLGNEQGSDYICWKTATTEMTFVNITPSSHSPHK